MLSDYQTTIGRPACFRGIGLHSGEISEIHILSGDPNQGFVFHSMSEWECAAVVRASIENAHCGDLRTVLKVDDRSIDTVEHILAALVGYGVDNAVIKIWGNEVPIMDGSTNGWIELINETGPLEMQAPYKKKLIRVTKRVKCNLGGAWCILEPNDGSQDLFLEYEMGYPHPMIASQSMSTVLNAEVFKNDLSRARTFGFFKDLDHIKSKGLAQGASLENTLVFDENNVINHDGLRWYNEPVRHKLVDAIGDLSLAGYRIAGRFRGYRSGHNLNQELIRTLMRDPESWKFEWANHDDYPT